MEITSKIDLDDYFPNKIIELHQQGLITLDEIIASGRIYTSFTSDLYNYVKSQQKLEIERMEKTVINTDSYDETQGTRMVTIKDRRKFARTLYKKAQ